jgi:hypothetical protein
LNSLRTRRPRNISNLKNAFNVRFDLYSGDYGPNTYPPSVNVRKGYIISNPADPCNTNNPPHPPAYDGVMGLPRDSCFERNNCTLAGGRMGDGDWGGDTNHDDGITDFEQYWSINFGSAPRPSGPGGLYSNTNLPSRYDVYRDEIDRNLQKTRSKGVQIGEKKYREAGNPQCSPGTGVDEPDRRIVYGAIVNCRAVGMSDRSSGPYQGVVFGKFFMTEPMSDDGTLWAELVDIVKPGNSDRPRDMVQLYR